MIRSLNKTPARGKPRFHNERIVAKPSTFSRVKFGTVIADIQLLENVTYQDFLDLMAVLDRIEDVERLVNDDIHPQVMQNTEDIASIKEEKIDKRHFTNLSALKNMTFDDTSEVTTGLCLIRDAFLDAIDEPSSDEVERTQRNIRRERAAKMAKKHQAVSEKIKATTLKAETPKPDQPSENTDQIEK